MTDKNIEFINKSKEIHGDKYDYSEVKYINNLTEVKIICKSHGPFTQLPKVHKRGNGCTKCSLLSMADIKISKSKVKFFNEIQEKDNEKRWDYTKAEQEFCGTNKNITLKCNGCGIETKRTPHKHLYEFQMCKRKCFTIPTSNFVLENNKIIIPNQTVIPEDIKEEWRIFPEDNNYSVSNRGYIKNLKTKKIIKGSLDKISGYMRTAIKKTSFFIHRIVAITFLPNPENKKTVNHKNKNRTDNRIENLEWSTHAEQNEHKNNKNKEYKVHNNGKTILRIRKKNNIEENTDDEIIEEYGTLILASKWILENIYKNETENKDINKVLKNISSGLSQKIKKNPNNCFVYGFIWKYKENNITYENEEWRLINNIEKEGYYISNYGRIKTPNNEINDKFGKSGGYYDLKIVQNGKHHKIHILVATYFIPNPEKKPFVNHKNGDKLDNKLENLEWVTNQENIQHAYDNGLVGGVSPVIQYDKKGENIIKEFNSINEASRELKINQSGISACCRGKIRQTHGFHFKYKKN